MQTYFPKYTQRLTRLGALCGPGFRTFFAENSLLPCPFWKPSETENGVGLELCFLLLLVLLCLIVCFPAGF